jgi:hypothetical protein
VFLGRYPVTKDNMPLLKLAYLQGKHAAETLLIKEGVVDSLVAAGFGAQKAHHSKEHPGEALQGAVRGGVGWGAGGIGGGYIGAGTGGVLGIAALNMLNAPKMTYPAGGLVGGVLGGIAGYGVGALTGYKLLTNRYSND